MKTEFFDKAQENLKAAQILFENDLYNAAANRVYYAVFQAAISALADKGIKEENLSHKRIHATFIGELIKKRKVYPSRFKNYLSDIQKVRNDADYKPRTVGKKVVSRQIRKANQFIQTIGKVIT